MDKTVLHQVRRQPGAARPVVFAYNLGNFMRRFGLPREVSHWSLRSVQLKLIKIGARFVSHSRRTVFQCAEVAVPATLFNDLLERIHTLVASPT